MQTDIEKVLLARFRVKPKCEALQREVLKHLYTHHAGELYVVCLKDYSPAEARAKVTEALCSFVLLGNSLPAEIPDIRLFLRNLINGRDFSPI